MVNGWYRYLNSWKRAGKKPLRFVFKILVLLIQLKFIHHLHYTPAKLSCMGLGVTAVCSRCNLVDADLLHMFWSCLWLSSYWRNVFSFFENQLTLPILQTPEVGTFRYTKRFCAQNPCSNPTLHSSVLCMKGCTIALEGCQFSNDLNPLPHYYWGTPQIQTNMQK